MGRRTGRSASVALLAVVVLLSIFAGHSPDRHAAATGGLSTPGTPSVNLKPDLGTRGRGPDNSPSAESSAVPEYPSSVVPQPTAQSGGPRILMDNAISAHHFDDAWALGYRGQGVRAAVVDQGVDFGHLDLQGTQAVVTDPASPYYGWPIAYDPQSLATYLRTGFPDNTLFSNTSRTGTGPFEVTHTIKIDGTNDFGDREKWALDPRDASASGPGGDKADFDLTDLYATRDAKNWYFGFPVYLRSQNASFTLLIDIDNETSGAYVAPLNTVDTNTSASDRVNDIRWSPDGSKVATVSGDRLVRIWDATTARVLLAMGPHAGEPLSVAWSPDGTKVASADRDHIKLWNSATGALIRDIQYVAFAEQPITENRVLSFSANGTWVAASTYKYVHFYNVNTGVSVGTLWAINGDVNGVAFSPLAGDRIAVALGNNQVRIYQLTPANLNPAAPAVAVYTLASHTQPVLEVAWSPDETKMVSTAKDNSAILWNLTTQTPIRTLTNQSSWVLSASWNAAGTQFVTGSRGLSPSINPSFAIWDGQGRLIRLVNQTKPMPGVDWSPFGSIATGSEDLTARIWTGAGDPVRTLIAHRPDYAMYVHGFSYYSDRESKYVHGTELATWYSWNTTVGAWDSIPLRNASGQQSALQFGDALFNEFSVPRARLGDPPAISVALFSSGENVSRAQDTVPSDRNVDFKGYDFSAGWSHLSAWAWRRIEEYRVQGLTSRSGVFHFGFHAAPSVQRVFGALGLLVVDSTTAGAYDKVYLDMNDDHVFDATDVVVTKANPIATIDAYDSSRNPNPDGYPDISAGMLYFLADGVHAIPYSDRLLQRGGADLKMRIPVAGDLVAFAGEFGVDPITTTPSEHGTRIASEIVAQGRLPTPIVGTANGVRLMSIMNGLSDPVEAWTFAVEGYDGRPGTSDDAQVVVSAFNFPTIHTDGWDVYSRTADSLSTQTSPTATFVASAGDFGFGYGTVSAPAAGPSVIAAGRAGDFSLRSSLYGGSEGTNPHFRDPAIAGSRGPTAAGFAKPELLAVDTTTVDIPLHSAADGTTAFSSAPMTGSDVSAGIVAGAVAIVVQAFNATHGRLPTVQEVRAVLMSGADAVGGDVLTQGAGFLNMSRAVRLAAGTADAGLLVTPSTWHPGGYRGAAYAGFSNLVYPGDSKSVPVMLRNQGTAAVTADLGVVSYSKIGEYTHSNGTHKDTYSPYGDITFWLNDTGVWKVDGATSTSVLVSPPIAGLWASADLVKVTAYSDLSRLVTKITTSYQTNYSYALRAYDWTKIISNYPQPAGLMFELNTVAEAVEVSNGLEVRVAFPAKQLHNALVISLEDVGTPTYIDALPWTFQIEFYRQTPWPWITLSQATVNVPPGVSLPVTANLAVPGGAPVGEYEAAILVHDTTHGTNTTIPVLVNVAAGGPNLSFGGDLTSTDLFDSNRLFGGYDRGLATSTRLQRPYAGDWRYYFFEIPDQGLYSNPSGYKILIQTSWPAKPSDVDTFAFGRTAGDAASVANISYYGAFTLKQSLKGDDLDKPDFKTATNTSQEFASYDLQSGLNVIALHAFSMRGQEGDVRIAGRAGWINAPSTVDVVTRNRAGRAPVAFMSNMNLPGLRASAVGPAQTSAFSNIEVPQDVQSWWNFPAWGEWMFRATFNYTFHVEKALILDVHIEGQSDVNDLDMGVFRNVAGAPCEWDPLLKDPLTGLDGYWKACVVDPEEYLVVDCVPTGAGLCVPSGPSTWGYNADGDADEEVKWVNPPDGEYTIKVLGFTVPSRTGHFDMQVSVTLNTGNGYAIPEAPKPAEIVNGTGGGLASFTRVGMNMTWDFPSTQAEASYGGAVLLGLPNAPGVVVVPASVTLDQTPPQITTFKIQPFNGHIDRATNDTTNDRRPIIVLGVADPILGQLVPTTSHVSIDGLDMTSFASVSVAYLTRANKLGLWEGTVSFATPPLADGSHTVNASIADRAGNVGYGDFSFAVDTAAPSLVLTGALRQFTRSATFAVSGQTEPGAEIYLRGSWRTVLPGGTFSFTVPLLNGTNDLAVTAADWFDVDASGNRVPGNSVMVTQTVIRDLVGPSFDRMTFEPTGPTQAAQTTFFGAVHDKVSAVEFGSVADLSLTVNGRAVTILSDGSFRVVLDLAEGSNAVHTVLADAAGNAQTVDTILIRDTTKPGLTLTTRPAAIVQTSQVSIAGTTESGAFVTVNGIFILAPNGRFSTNVTLSPGPNTIVVESRDPAGNVASETVHVTYGSQGGSLLLPVGVGIGVVAAVLVVLFVLARRGVRIPGFSRGRPSEEVPEEETAEEPEEAAPVEEEIAPAEPAPVVEDPRVARLRKAFEEGRISQQVYEENLRRIQGGS